MSRLQALNPQSTQLPLQLHDAALLFKRQIRKSRKISKKMLKPFPAVSVFPGSLIVEAH